MAIIQTGFDDSAFNFLAGRMPVEMAKEFGNAAWLTAARFRDVFRFAQLRGRPGLNRITGALWRSFRVGRSPRGTPLDDVFSFVASGSPYARIHETGGTIRPKRRRALAIPLRAAKTEAGATKGEAVRVMARTTTFGVGGTGVRKPGRLVTVRKGERSLYARTDLTFIKTRKGTALLVKRIGEGRAAKIVPMYVLKGAVRIPARLRFVDTFRQWASKPRALRFFVRALRKVADKLQRGGRG